MKGYLIIEQIKLFFITFSIITNTCITNAQELEQICELNLPVVIINTVNNEIPTCETVYAPEGADGIGKTNVNKVPCSVSILLHDKILYESGEYKENKSGAKINVRGNTSSSNPQKPYKLKLEKKADLLMRGNDKLYKDKEWVLVYENDLKTFIGLTLNKLVDMPYKPEFKPVNVFLNNHYEGLYYLMESVKRNEHCRINVDKETGYIYEYDVYWWQEDYYIPLEFDKQLLAFTIKYPEKEDLTDDRKSYSESWLKDLQHSVLYGYSEHYLYLDTCARWILAQDLLGNSDGGGSNLYFVKEDNKSETKAYIPTLWDFDGICNKDHTWSDSHCWGDAFFWYMFNYPNNKFDKSYCQEWINMNNKKVTEALIDSLYRFAHSDEGKDFEVSHRLTSLLYNKSDSLWSIESRVKEYEDWFTARHQWMNNKLYKKYPVIMRRLRNEIKSDFIYDVLGRIVDDTYKGIKIVDGQQFH